MHTHISTTFQDWGEQFVDRRLSRLFVADFAAKTVAMVTGAPDAVAVGDAVWTPDGKGLVFIGFPVPERRLGLIYWCVL